MRVRPAVLLLLLLLAGLSPSLVQALALGEITLNSRLNEPLDAAIEVLNATPEEIDNLNASIASRETFERYGLNRPDFLSGLKFQVAKSGTSDVLLVRSLRPVSEPFVTFLVEAEWRRGTLLREYTVLLDPPVFLPTPETAAAPAPVIAPRSVRSQTRPSSGQIVRDPAPRRSASRRNTATPSYGTSYGPIQRNETLWSIAQRLRTDRSISMNQMMVAIYQANQGAFLDNINLMKEGSVLRIPDRAAIESLAQPEAYSIAVAHNRAWRSGSPARVASSGTAPSSSSTTPDSSRLRLVEPDGAASSTGAGSSAADGVASETLARNEADIARLSGENEQLRADLDEIRRLLNIRDAELAQVQQQVGSGLSTSGGPELATPATDTAASVTDSSDTTTTTITATDSGTTTVDAGTDTGTDIGATDTSAATDAQTPETAVDSTAFKPPVSTSLPDEPGFIAKAIEMAKGAFSNLWVLIGLGIVALGAFGMMALRGRGATDGDPIEALTREAKETVVADTTILPQLDIPTHETPPSLTLPPMPALKEAAEAPAAEDVEFFEDSGTFKPVDFSAAQASADPASGEYPFEDTVGGEIKLDQSDPLAEADFHMAYGLYDQASDLVKKAVAREPARIDLRMKLLEIFFVWGNQADFRATAQDMKDNMSDAVAPEWDKIAIMGKQICPDDDLFAGDAGMGSGADIDLEFEPTGASAAVDLDFDADPGQPVAADVDLDIGGALGESAVASGAFDTLNEDMLDFDIGAGAAEIDNDDDTRPEPVESIKDQIRARLSSTDTDETAEMDLSDLGVDLNLDAKDNVAEEAAGATDSAFGDIFGDADTDFAAEEASESDSSSTSELPAATSEMTAGGNALDLDMGDVFGGLESEDNEETARDLEALEESMEQTGSPFDDAADTGNFSAEVETLHGDALDVDISAFNDEDADATRLIAPDEVGSEEAFSSAIFGDDDADGGDETKLIGPEDSTGSYTEDVFSATVFGEEETAQVPAMDLPSDNGLDLDIGESMAEVDEGGTTAKVSTSELALPGGDDELSEVGTKLDLARAYMDMGDPDGARGILEEVMAEGNEGQQADAREMLTHLG